MSHLSLPLPRSLSPRSAFALAAGIVGLALFASGTPSPLYGLYRSLWGFSPAVLTLVYGTYAFGVLAALLVAGRLSDEVGRRPVLLIALATLMVTAGVFMVADSVAWLFVARGLQGLATGLALSAASAALLDLHPRRDPVGAGLANGVASVSGMGLGVLISSAVVQWLPDPRVLPYVVLEVLFAAALAMTLRLDDPVAPSPDARPRLRPQRPGVPPVVRGPFLLAALGVISSWSTGGLFLSLGPELAGSILHSGSPIVAGLAIFSLPAAGAIAQILYGRRAAWAGAAVGSLVLAAGMGLLVIAAATASGVLFLVACVAAGAGFGVAFLGALRALSSAIPPAHRAAVMSAFYVVAYAAISVPAVIAGFLTTPLGLTSTFEVFGSAIAALALVVAAEAWRTRPRAAATGCAAAEPAGV